MAITLRVVGIFYRTEVDVAGGQGTVKDVLDAAQAQITAGTSFTYSTVTTKGYSSPNMFRAFYEAPFVSPASGQEYPAGEYMLTEQLDQKPAYTVWQYYIFDKDGRFINRDRGFIPFDDPKLAIVEDGQSVTWRLVTIVAPPDSNRVPRLNRALVS